MKFGAYVKKEEIDNTVSLEHLKLVENAFQQKLDEMPTTMVITVEGNIVQKVEDKLGKHKYMKQQDKKSNVWFFSIPSIHSLSVENADLEADDEIKDNIQIYNEKDFEYVDEIKIIAVVTADANAEFVDFLLHQNSESAGLYNSPLNRFGNLVYILGEVLQPSLM